MRNTKASAEPRTPAPPYQLTPRERSAVDSYFEQRAKVPPAPDMKLSEPKNNVSRLEPDHPDAKTAYVLLGGAVGATSAAFLKGLLDQLANAGRKGPGSAEDGLNFMLAVVRG